MMKIHFKNKLKNRIILIFIEINKEILNLKCLLIQTI